MGALASGPWQALAVVWTVVEKCAQYSLGAARQPSPGQNAGFCLSQGRQRCLFMDSKGLVCASRSDLQPHKRPFAHDLPFQRTLLEAVRAFKPTALVGVSTMQGAFTPEVIKVGGPD